MKQRRRDIEVRVFSAYRISTGGLQLPQRRRRRPLVRLLLHLSTFFSSSGARRCEWG
jgi:hypothetical protein